MSRTRPTYDVKQIREFSSRNSSTDWLPSVGNEDSYQNTFSLMGSNPIIGGSSKGEINVITNFAQEDDKDINLKRFTLALYCLRHQPYFFNSINESLDYKESDVLFLKSFEDYLKTVQTGNGQALYSRSLTADIVRTYRSSASKENLDSIDNDKSIQSLINYSRTSKDYRENVTGVLGKVTYDSIIKHTLYSLLLSNGLIKDYAESTANSWSDKANLLKSGEFGLYVDVSGGQFKRAFPVICVYSKDKSGKKISDLIEASNSQIKAKFSRNPSGTQQLVSTINVGGEKNFLEYPIRDTGYSAYCILYDLTKVLILPPAVDETFTLDLLKIGLSLLSRNSSLTFNNLSEFETKYQKISSYLKNSFKGELEELNFKILYPNKHISECEYALGKEKNSLKAKLSGEFKAELENLLKSLEDSYTTIINIFNSQTSGKNQNFQFETYSPDYQNPIILHFDNFYNLLAITSTNQVPQIPSKDIPKDVPFDLEEYKTTYKNGDLINKFFKEPKSLPTYADKQYLFAPSIAKEQDIVLITDVFLKQLYENLDKQGKGIVYENDDNQKIDNVLSDLSFELLDLINTRTGFEFKKSDYFYISSGNIYLRNETVKKLSLKELQFAFSGTNEDKVKFQTISYLLFISAKGEVTIDDFRESIYYPKLKQVEVSPTEKESNKPEPPTPSKIQKENNNYLINNIITSELSCYEDISNSFDAALNSEKPEDKIYYAAETLVNIGLPILLSYASQMIASKLAELSSKLDPSLLDCLLSDSANLKKMILGFADLASSNNPEDYLLQYAAQLPELPLIPYFPVFDLEKEIKRRLVAYVIEQMISLLKDSLAVALQPVIDMCNSDSYLTAFLDSAIPDVDTSANKSGTSTASGLPAGNTSTIYIPSVTVNINELIEQTGIETRENVYETFRTTFFVEEEEYSNQEISDFFDYLSDKIDAGEMFSLLKGTSTPQTRSLILGYIENYELNKFRKIIADEQSVAFLFVLLSQFIDYTIVMETISKSLNNFIPSVCVDINSNFDEYSSKYPVDAIDGQTRELESSLNDACVLKKPLKIDILSGGPSLLTRGLKKAMNSAIGAVYNTNIPVPQKLTKETVAEIYEKTKINNKINNRISAYKSKSNFVLKEMFDIGMTITSTSGRYLQDNDGKLFFASNSLDRFYNAILNDSGKIGDKQSLPLPYSELYGFNTEQLNSFLSSYDWDGKELGQPPVVSGVVSPPDYSGYNGKVKDNQITDLVFKSAFSELGLLEITKKNSKFTKKIIGLWKAFVDYPFFNDGGDKTLFDGVSVNPYYYLAMNARYTDSFKNQILKNDGKLIEEDEKFISDAFKILQKTPSLEQYFLFALKLFQRAVKIEEELSPVNFAAIKDLIDPWYELPTSYLTGIQFKEPKNFEEFNTKINNAGNIGLKTEESSLSGYIRKYEIIRGTKTQIYDSKTPGDLSDGIIINFVED